VAPDLGMSASESFPVALTSGPTLTTLSRSALLVGTSIRAAVDFLAGHSSVAQCILLQSLHSSKAMGYVSALTPLTQGSFHSSYWDWELRG
jgi:hypothetical protein